MAYKVIILYQLYMPSYFLGTFTEYPYYISVAGKIPTAYAKEIKNDTLQKCIDRLK